MHGGEVLVFVEHTGSDTTELLHMRTGSQQQTQVHTQSSDVGTSFTGNLEGEHVPEGTGVLGEVWRRNLERFEPISLINNFC